MHKRIIILLSMLLVLAPVMQSYAFMTATPHASDSESMHHCCDETSKVENCCSDRHCNGDCNNALCAGGNGTSVILQGACISGDVHGGSQHLPAARITASYATPPDIRPPISDL